MWNKENTLSFVLLTRNSKLFCFLTFTQQLKMLNSDKRYDLVLHRIQQYLGLKQNTIPVDESTPKRKRDPLVRWYSQVSTCVLFFFHTRICPVRFQSYLQTSEEDPSFQVCQENIPYCSKPDHTHGKTETGFLFLCILINTFSRTQISQIHQLNGGRVGEGTGMLTFWNY